MSGVIEICRSCGGVMDQVALPGCDDPEEHDTGEEE